MIEFSKDAFVMSPAEHQVRGVKTLLRKKAYGLFWEMRLRKSATVITAADCLFRAREIDAVVVVCPKQVKKVWTDSELGEIATHSKLKLSVHDYCSRWEHCTPELNFNYEQYWVVASLEFLRQEDSFGKFPKVEALIAALGNKRFWLVADEGSELGNYKSLQTKAVRRLREKANRFTLLDGTPVHSGQLVQYSKFGLLDPNILGFKNFHQFANVHGVKGGYKGKGIVGFKGQSEDIERVGRDGISRVYKSIDSKVKDHCEFLERKDIKDMDWKDAERSFFTVALTPKTWKVYCQMRDEMLADLDTGRLLVQHAHVRALRLAQICAGFIGGVTAGTVETPDLEQEYQTVELSNETRTDLLGWLKTKFEQQANFKCVVWCRWRAEIESLLLMLESLHKHLPPAYIYSKGVVGIDLLHPANAYDGPLVLVAQPQAARYGKNFSKADTAVYLSRDYNLVTASQSEDRIQAPGQLNFLLDCLVTGPDGQKTITWDIRKTVVSKTNIAQRTTEAWKKALEE